MKNYILILLFLLFIVVPAILIQFISNPIIIGLIIFISLFGGIYCIIESWKEQGCDPFNY